MYNKGIETPLPLSGISPVRGEKYNHLKQLHLTYRNYSPFRGNARRARGPVDAKKNPI
jgi:hypothetical protein